MRATIFILTIAFSLLVSFSSGRAIKRSSLNRLSESRNSVRLAHTLDAESTSGDGRRKQRKRNAPGGNLLESLLAPVNGLQNAARPGLLGGGAGQTYGTAPNGNVQSNGNQGLLGLDHIVGQILPKPAAQPQNAAPPYYGTYYTGPNPA